MVLKVIPTFHPVEYALLTDTGIANSMRKALFESHFVAALNEKSVVFRQKFPFFVLIGDSV